MRYMEHLDGVLGLIDREFAEMERNGQFKSKDEIELTSKMMDVVKDAAEYCEKFEEMQNLYSETGYGYGYGQYPMDNYSNNQYSNNGYSYARGRNARRDSMGRYSNEGSYAGGNRSSAGMRQSRADANEEYLNRLRAEAENAPNERVREHMLRMIREMEQ